jgi:tRNA nucleotidyltransferase/poly(A) polymerase
VTPLASTSPLEKTRFRREDPDGKGKLGSMEARELTLPGAVQRLIETLGSDGHRAALVGRCVRALIAGRVARDFQVASSAPAERVLTLFPHAVPIAPRYRTIMVPTPAGPVDITSFSGGALLEDDLARRDFTIEAIAYDPIADDGPRLIDPQGGLRDLEAGRLRAVGTAWECLEQDPLRALRAARLVAELPVSADAALQDAMTRVRPALRSLAAQCIRQEISRLLLAPRAGAGLDLLRRSGIEATLAPGVLSDAAQLVDQLPHDLTLRLAGWLHGTRAAKTLVRLRFSAPLVRDVERLLALHPLDDHLSPTRATDLHRLIKRAGDTNVDRLFELRRAELEMGRIAGDEALEVRARLSELRMALDRARSTGKDALRQTRLAIGGREVMEVLQVGPGPWVGRALRYLAEQVHANPACNTEGELRELLRAWREVGL